MNAFLELKNLSIGYKKSLVSDINTEASLGEVILLMGNNGVGKTTLIKTLLKQIQIFSLLSIHQPYFTSTHYRWQTYTPKHSYPNLL